MRSHSLRKLETLHLTLDDRNCVLQEPLVLLLSITLAQFEVALFSIRGILYTEEEMPHCIRYHDGHRGMMVIHGKRALVHICGCHDEGDDMNYDGHRGDLKKNYEHHNDLKNGSLRDDQRSGNQHDGQMSGSLHDDQESGSLHNNHISSDQHDGQKSDSHRDGQKRGSAHQSPQINH